MNENRRVVITGLGVISSIGIGREEFWYKRIYYFLNADSSRLPARPAGGHANGRR